MHHYINIICAFDSTLDMVIELSALSEIFHVVSKPGCGPWACPALLRWSSEKGERVRVLIIPPPSRFMCTSRTISSLCISIDKCCLTDNNQLRAQVVEGVDAWPVSLACACAAHLKVCSSLFVRLSG